MKIVDAQVHTWAAETPERPWPKRAAPHRAPLGKEELLAEMDKAGVDAAVLVPPSWEGDCDMSRLPCSYRQDVTFFTKELPWLKGPDLE